MSTQAYTPTEPTAIQPTAGRSRTRRISPGGSEDGCPEDCGRAAG